jgi:hypothetical protein
MATKKKSRNITVQEARKLRNGDPSIEEMESFFSRRDSLLAALKNPVDILEYSPMILCRIWTQNPDLPYPELSKQERATIKGRYIEAERAKKRAEQKATEQKKK